MLWLANYLEREMDLMYKLLKKAFIGCLLFGLMSATASAETLEVDGNKISYDYGNNKIGITQDTEKEKQQLTVLLVKGDATSDITGDQIYYVDQTEGTSFVKAFSNLGVKGGHLPPGTYTLIAGGDNVGNGFKETVIIGNVDADSVKNKLLQNATFYTNRDTAIVEYDDVSEKKYAYATISDFTGDVDNDCGWLLQYIDAKGTVYQLVKTIDKLNTTGDVTNIDGNTTVSVGLQINGIPVKQKDFVAIPFRNAATN